MIKSDSNNNRVLQDFISVDSFTIIDGLIVKDKTTLNYIKTQIDSQNRKWDSFNSLNAFLKNNIEVDNYAFINVDEVKSVSETESLKLFQKTRGKTKIIFYNDFKKTLNEVSFYKFIGWMRLITMV